MRKEWVSLKYNVLFAEAWLLLVLDEIENFLSNCKISDLVSAEPS